MSQVGNAHDGRTMPFQRILTGTDFSSASDAALFTALAMGRRLEARVDVFHAVDRPDPQTYAREARERLARVDGIEAAEVHVEACSAGELLLGLREECSPDLLVLGASGQRWLRHMLLGSLCQRALHTPGCPLLIVSQAPLGGLFKQVLVALEEPDLESPALRIGLAMCHQLRGELTLLHVLPPHGYISDRRRVELAPESVPERLEQVAAHVDPSIPVRVEVRDGDPSVEIPRVARKLGAEVVVMGAERGPDGEPGATVDRVAASGLPAAMFVWPEADERGA